MQTVSTETIKRDIETNKKTKETGLQNTADNNRQRPMLLSIHSQLIKCRWKSAHMQMTKLFFHQILEKLKGKTAACCVSQKSINVFLRVKFFKKFGLSFILSYCY